MFDIAPNERVALVGMTKSGKTYFARAILSHAKRLVVLDPKGLLYNRTDWNLEHFDEQYKRLEAGRDARLWVPPPLDDAEYEETFDKIMRLRNVLVYIDELYGVGPAQGSRGLRAIFTRGRELGIGVWACSQRPKWIPRYALSEAEWRIMFRLEEEDDRIYMSKTIGRIALSRLPGHACIIYHDGHATLLPNGITVQPSALVKEKRR